MKTLYEAIFNVEDEDLTLADGYDCRIEPVAMITDPKIKGVTVVRKPLDVSDWRKTGVKAYNIISYVVMHTVKSDLKIDNQTIQKKLEDYWDKAITKYIMADWEEKDTIVVYYTKPRVNVKLFKLKLTRR